MGDELLAEAIEAAAEKSSFPLVGARNHEVLPAAYDDDNQRTELVEFIQRWFSVEGEDASGSQERSFLGFQPVFRSVP